MACADKRKIVINVSTDGRIAQPLGFDSVLLLTPEAEFSDLVRVYTDADGASDDFDTDTWTYNQIAAIFSQTPTVARVYVGRQDTDSIDGFVGELDLTEDAEVTVTINGKSVTFAPGTAAEAVESLEAAFPFGLTFADGGAGVTGDFIVDITGPAGVSYTVTESGAADSTFTAAGSLDPGADLTAINEEVSGWFAVLQQSTAVADQLAVSAWLRTNTDQSRGIQFVQTWRPEAVGISDDTDVLSQLIALEDVTTFCMYHSDAWQPFAAALMGKGLGRDVDQQLVPFTIQTLTGVAQDSLSSTDTTALLDKGYCIYVCYCGSSATDGGKTGSGEWFDSIIAIAWIVQQLRARTCNLMLRANNNGRPIPLDNAGSNIVTGVARRLYNDAVNNGIARDGTLQLVGWDRANMTAAQIASRIVTIPQFQFEPNGFVDGLIWDVQYTISAE